MNNVRLGSVAGDAAGLVQNLQASAEKIGKSLFVGMVVFPGFGRQVRFRPQLSVAVRHFPFSFEKLPWQL